MDESLNKNYNEDEIIIARDINKKVTEKYINLASKIKSIYEKAIKYTSNKKGYSEKYLDMGTVLNEVKLCSELSIIKTFDKTISVENFDISKMANEIINSINGEYSISLPQSTIKKYKKLILGGLDNKSSSFTYELLFYINNESKVLSSILTNIRFDVIEEKKKVLGITVKKKKIYKINIKSLLVNGCV
ncbi:MAG: hypothetical protein E7214_05920 [Clostridium sp.]|nr:hypothetical protein [Clostridium sp.]